MAKLISQTFLDIIVKQQHGFSKGRSALTNLVVNCDFISTFLKNNKQIDSFYLDFSKAFDLVNHNRLLDKIWNYRVRGSLFSWIQSYLTNRSYAVRVRGRRSDCFLVPSGVPQGSCVGTILFPLFINDLSSIIKFSQVLFYADDTKIYKAINPLLECTKLQKEIKAFYNWSRANGLPINIQK